MLGYYVTVSCAGELATAIGVNDERLSRPALVQSHAQSSDDQWSVQQLTHGPADHAAGEQIQDHNQIQPTLTCEHASGVAGPDLIEPPHGETSQLVRSNGSAVTAVSGAGSILGALPSVKTLLAHEPGDAVALCRAAQHMSDSRAAIGSATAGKLFSDLLS